MLASHICVGCGRELCRESAPPDPVYGLPIVVCPRCGLACVRRGHRANRIPARFWRVIGLVWLLVGHVLMLSLLTAILLGFVAVVVHTARKLRIDPFQVFMPNWAYREPVAVIADAMPPLIVMMIVMICGIWFGVQLTHWRRRAWVLGGVGLMGALALLPMAWSESWHLEAGDLVDGLRLVTMRFEALVPAMLALAIGVRIGMPKDNDSERIRRARFRKVRSRVRRRQAKARKAT